jgi:hypothetical protein
MKRILTAVIAALSLALSSLAVTPALARDRDNDDAAKVILGIAALGLLLNQSNQNRVHDSQNRGFFRYDDNGYDDDDYDRHHNRYGRQRLVPAECLFDVRIDGRYREVLSGRCLGQFGFSRRLPDECAFDIRYRGGYRTVYGPRCLRDYGYRIGSSRY